MYVKKSSKIWQIKNIVYNNSVKQNLHYKLKKMNQLINSPIEIPNVNEEVKKKPEIKEGMYKEISTTREEIREQFKWLPDVKVDIFDNRIPKLTLTWKRNV